MEYHRIVSKDMNVIIVHGPDTAGLYSASFEGLLEVGGQGKTMEEAIDDLRKNHAEMIRLLNDLPSPQKEQDTTPEKQRQLILKLYKETESLRQQLQEKDAKILELMGGYNRGYLAGKKELTAELNKAKEENDRLKSATGFSGETVGNMVFDKETKDFKIVPTDAPVETQEENHWSALQIAIHACSCTMEDNDVEGVAASIQKFSDQENAELRRELEEAKVLLAQFRHQIINDSKELSELKARDKEWLEKAFLSGFITPELHPGTFELWYSRLNK